MSIEVLRIDDRLIHGQVVEGWISKLDIAAIWVANERIAGDFLQKTLMEMAVPSRIELFVGDIPEVLQKYNSENVKNKKIMILVDSPKDAFLLIDGGLQIESINVGGMHFSDGKIQILEFMSIDVQDLEYFRAISNKNIKIEGRPLPDFEKIDIMKKIMRFESENKCEI